MQHLIRSVQKSVRLLLWCQRSDDRKLPKAVDLALGINMGGEKETQAQGSPAQRSGNAKVVLLGAGDHQQEVDETAQRSESRIDPVCHSVRRQDAQGLIPAAFKQNAEHPHCFRPAAFLVLLKTSRGRVNKASS